ncbi:MAG TPA: RsiV family protein [Pseudolabrys sp.]|nr:RsiV family protein [Pseudolabrys sp.]
MRCNASRCLIAALAAVALCLPNVAAADDEKPVLSIATKSIEASIQIDDTLKAYPGLYDNLLAEGRRGLAKWRLDADKDRKATPEIFRDGRRYSHDRGYTQRSVIGRYVSVLRTDYFDGIGAHPNTVLNTILWDIDAKKPVSIRPLFKETADNGPTLKRLTTAIRAALAVIKRSQDIPVADPETDESLAGVQPKLLEIGAIALAPSTETGKSAGMLFYFSPYAVGPYVEGAFTAFVPWTAFKDDLSAQGAALFGGERPQDDIKDD